MDYLGLCIPGESHIINKNIIVRVPGKDDVDLLKSLLKQAGGTAQQARTAMTLTTYGTAGALELISSLGNTFKIYVNIYYECCNKCEKWTKGSTGFQEVENANSGNEYSTHAIDSNVNPLQDTDALITKLENDIKSICGKF